MLHFFDVSGVVVKVLKNLIPIKNIKDAKTIELIKDGFILYTARFFIVQTSKSKCSDKS